MPPVAVEASLLEDAPVLAGDAADSVGALGSLITPVGMMDSEVDDVVIIGPETEPSAKGGLTRYSISWEQEANTSDAN